MPAEVLASSLKAVTVCQPRFWPPLAVIPARVSRVHVRHWQGLRPWAVFLAVVNQPEVLVAVRHGPARCYAWWWPPRAKVLLPSHDFVAGCRPSHWPYSQIPVAMFVSTVGRVFYPPSAEIMPFVGHDTGLRRLYF